LIVAEVENDHFGMPAGVSPVRSRKFGRRPVAGFTGQRAVS
jgi:hypothetical protein